ncbi:MAG: isoprenylcysteine carboxylmethyltransferase family protein [Anaerolineales bacterium]
MNIKELIGIGDKTGRIIFPIIIIGILINILFRSYFFIGGPSSWLLIISTIVLIIGLINCIWSQILIIINVPKHKLITSGPFSIVKHPLYTGVSLLVIPWVGLLINTWLGVVIGITLFIILRIYAPEEEKKLSNIFGIAWTEYTKKVRIPWL